MANSENNELYYTSAGDIFGVFRALQTDRSSINIQIGKSGQLYNSLVLETNLNERYILLDEVTPRDGHKKIEGGEIFSIRGSVNGIRVHAKDMKVAKTLTDKSGIYYRVPFPKSLLYLQRRAAFRARVPGSMMVGVSMNSAERPDTILIGKVVDLSATGIRINFPGEIEPELEVLETFTAQITIAAQELSIDCKLELRHRGYTRDRDVTSAGFRFSDMGRVEQLTINRLVTQLQREGMV